MHICHLAKYYPPATGGIESHVQTLARGQANAGHQVTVVCVNHCSATGDDVRDRWREGAPAIDELDKGVRVIRARRSGALSKLDLSPGLRRVIREIQISRSPADVIHLHTPNATMMVALLGVASDTPLVITHHSDIIKQVWLGKAYEFLERRLLRRAATILTTSPQYANGSMQLQEFLQKVRALPLGIDLSPYLNPSTKAQAFQKSLQQQFGNPLWLAVGRLVYYKGLTTAVEALRAMPGHLAIVGDGPLRSQLERRSVELGVADRVAFLGHLGADELIGAYHAATAFLFPSNARSEGFGLVQVEAMASGCPVINTRIRDSGTSWVSRHEESGLTVSPNAPNELATAALKLLDDSQLRKQLSEGAKRRACELFDHQTMAQSSIDVYQSVLANAARRIA
ncbi:MAG: glycosyl transferase family 1 [Pirellula sp.]|nr:glycosyl transferase family 1 [Pirellula sp.]